MKFSVIIPLYNKAPYVRKALESVCAQTCRDYELIVINDGSIDNSAVVANEYLKATDGIDYQIISQQNAGVSAARNNGVAQAHGDYIAFLDADDWWEPTYLERMAQLIADYPDAGLYACNYVYYKPGKTHVALNIPTGYINYPKAYYENGAMPVTSITAILPRKIFNEIGGFPLGIRLGEDFLLWARIALRYPVAFLNEPLAWYNNDIPATLRATRNLHSPECHMLFRLDLAMNTENDKAEVHSYSQLSIANRPTNSDWSLLIDKLRISGLLEYWLDKRYHDLAAEELKKVDWNQQTNRVKRIYKTPICLLKLKRWVMHVGSWCKQLLIRR